MSCNTFHKGKYFVSYKRGFEDCKKCITVTVDKVFENDCLKISLSDESDPSFLCIIDLTRCDYEDLKKQQGLLIDFDNFPSQLVRLLQQCASNNMFLILQQTNPLHYFFEIIEHNEFKKLVHLSLKTGPANDTDIKQHMADRILNLEKSLSSLKMSSSTNEALWNDKSINMERKIQDLTHVISKMEEDKLKREMDFQELLKKEKDHLNQEYLRWQKNIETNTKSQVAISQENLNRKDRQIEEINTQCRQLQDKIGQLENQLSEKIHRLNVLEKEVQKSHIEVATLKAKNASLEKDVVDKEKMYNQLNSRCGYLEKSVKDNMEIIKDLNYSLDIARKEKTNLEEKLAFTESLVNNNNQAVQSTSDQLLKANQIISKQNSDLIEMKDKLLCRTAIALEQEKVIERNSKELEELHTLINTMNQEMDKLKKEIGNLKEKYDNNEKALQDKDETIRNNNMVIQWLHKKMEETCGPSDMLQSKKQHGILSATSSTPYFLPKNSNNHINSSHTVSDESIDFYATSKLSNVEESPGPAVQENIRLDPKYLKPAASANMVKKKEDMKSTGSQNQTQKGKENKIVNLPKVDYREKKTSRSSTYRPTPVSAYFP